MQNPSKQRMTGTDLPVLENQAAYIAGWLRHIRDGSAVDVIRAAADAQRAADFLTGGGGEASSFSRAGAAGEFAPGGRCRTSPWFFPVYGIAGALTRSRCSLRDGCSCPPLASPAPPGMLAAAVR